MTLRDLSVTIDRSAPHIARDVLRAVIAEQNLAAYHSRTETELIARFQDVCRNLAQWLEARNDWLVRDRYSELARERIEEKVPLSEIVLAAQIFERELVRRLRERSHRDEPALEEKSVDVIREFFNQVILNIVIAYEESLLRELI